MTDQPREKLCELIATYGQTLCDDPRRCEALLRDLCAANRREIHVLVSALRERVAADLLTASEGIPREVLRARLTQRLQDNLGLAGEIAQWAVDSWALALGKLSRAELGAAAPRKAVSEGNVEAKQPSLAELDTVAPSSAPIASHTAPIGGRQRLGSPRMYLAHKILLGAPLVWLVLMMLGGLWEVISSLGRSTRTPARQQVTAGFPRSPYPVTATIVNAICAVTADTPVINGVQTCYKGDWQPWVIQLQHDVNADASLDEDSLVQSPATFMVDFPDGSTRVVFSGCRPHACPDADAYFLVDPTTRKLDIVWRTESGVRYFGPTAPMMRDRKLYEQLTEWADEAKDAFRTKR